MLRANRPILAFFDAIKALRIRQLALVLKAGYDPNLLLNVRGQNGLQFMINYFGATDAHYRLQAPINKSAYLSIAKLLLDSGLDPNAMDLLTDETVLFDAIRYNDTEMVALLLNYVDLALRNKNGETALMCAARFGSKQVVRLILEHLHHLDMDSYFLRQRNRFGLTALEIARSENLEAAKVLTKHLIAYGSSSSVAAGALLARSVSHHQLAGASYGPTYRQAPTTQLPLQANRLHRRRHHHDLLIADECLSPSDYDSDILGPQHARAPLVGGGGGGAGTGSHAQRPQLPAPSAAVGAFNYHHQAYYDPKAAEFNQYLLQQHAGLDSNGEPMPMRASYGLGGGGGGGSSQTNARNRNAGPRTLSDDEDCYVGGGVGGGGMGGQLIRSRSCMLGPAASGGSSKAAVAGSAYGKKGSTSDAVGKMASAWQDQAGGAGGGPGQ